MKSIQLLSCQILAILSCCYAQRAGIKTVFQWRRLEYLYDSQEQLQADLDSGVYNRSVPAPIDVDVFYRPFRGTWVPTFFVSVPKFQDGVPSSFNIVSDQIVNGEYALQPFPNWSWHRNLSACNPNRLVSVYRVKVDPCGRLWVLDSGNPGDEVTCPPQVVVFDLNRNWDQPIYRHEFDESLYDSTSRFLTIQLDQDRFCRRTFAYIADCISDALIVLDANRDVSWRIQHSSMNESDQWTTFEIAGDTFELDDGILGIGVTPPNWRNHRSIIYSPMAGNLLSAIDTHRLRSSQNYNEEQISSMIHTYPGGRRSQSPAMDVTSRGVAVFGLVSNISINCWNVNSNDYGPFIHTVYSNEETMQFASGLKVSRGPNWSDERVWIMTSRFQLYGAYDFSEVNFRISSGNLARLIPRGHPCSRPDVPNQ